MRKKFLALTLAATVVLGAVPALAGTGVGEFGEITVEAICVTGEPGRRISVTADPDAGFDPPLYVFSADATAYHIKSLQGYYTPGETKSYDLLVSEYDTDAWYLFIGFDGDAAFQAETSSPAGECDGGGGDVVYPGNIDRVKGNSKGVCKAVLVHADGAGAPTMTVELSDGSTETGSGWMTGRAWHFAVDHNAALTPVNMWVELNGSSPYPDHDPRLNVGRC